MLILSNIYVTMVFNSVFFFFKQKTAYEMRISDWSSDVCSSDLSEGTRRKRRWPERTGRTRQQGREGRHAQGGEGQGRRRAEQAEDDAADVRGSDRRAQLSRRADLGAMEEAQQVRDRSGSGAGQARRGSLRADRKSTRLNSSH